MRHHQGEGEAWPDRVSLEVVDAQLHVTAPSGPVGSWPLGDARAVRLTGGPPVSFVLELPGAAHLLAAASGPSVERLLAALTS